MPGKTFARFAALIVFIAASAIATAQAPAAHLAIQGDRQVSPVSPTLYGLMTEEINYSYDGGLYAEMVRNRTFRADWSGILYGICSKTAAPPPRWISTRRPARATRSKRAFASTWRRPAPAMKRAC